MTEESRLLFCISIIIGLILFFFSSKSNFIAEKDEGIYKKPFEDYVVFYPQHQDDEVLWGGSAIRTAIKECGVDNVFVVLVSDGIEMDVFKNRKYKDMSKADKIELRNNEFRAALKTLGVKNQNTIILSDIDKKSEQRFELMEKVALDIEKKLKNVTHVAHSYKHDDHQVHRKNGEVIYELHKSGKIKDSMYFLKPQHVDEVPENKTVIYDSMNEGDYDIVKSACLEYKKIDKLEGREGIGYISSHDYFEDLLKDKKLTSVLHLPY